MVRHRSVPLTLIAIALIAGSGCRGDLKNGGGDPNDVIAQVIIVPPNANITTVQTAQFQGYGITVGGDSVSVSIDWTADGGTLLSNGTFSSANAGVFEVVGRARIAPHPSDTVSVTVAAPPVTLTSIVITPVAPIIAPGEARPFIAEAHFSDSTLAPASVTWTGTGGTIDAAGLYTAGSVEGTFQVIATSNVAAVAETSIVTINAIAPTVTRVTLSPDIDTVLAGAQLQYQAFASYSDGTFAPANVVFSASAGSITSGGLLTASQTPGTYSVLAQHLASGFADTAAVVVSAPTLVRVTLSPPTNALNVGSLQQFTVTGTLSNGTTGPVAVNFTATGGTISPGGLYTAGQTTGGFIVVATGVSNPVADTSTVTINRQNVTLVRIRLRPATAAVLSGGTVQFTSTGQFSDGTQAPVNVQYSTTAGTITPGGLYTAPAVAGTYPVISRALTGGVADTAVVTVNVPGTLSRIDVTPQSANILTGAIQQFAATGTLTDNSTVNVSVNWSATGGTINSSGQYLAGTTTGTFRVIAVHTGGTLADTAAVTISAFAPPTSNACTNEPPGLIQLFDTPWNAVPPLTPAKDAAGWNVRTTVAANRLSIQSDAQAPSSPPNNIAGKFPQGSSGGSAPFGLDRHFGKNVTTIYNCMFTFLDPLFTNNGNAGTKFGFLLTPYNSGTQSVNHYFNLTNNLGINLQSNNAILNRNMLSSFSLVGHRGQWVKLEFLVVGNSLGNSDGIARMWVNGTQVLNATNVQYFYPSQNPAFNGITWNPTYGGGLNPVPYDMYHSIDNWYLSTD
jgi:hypothetical protein